MYRKHSIRYIITIIITKLLLQGYKFVRNMLYVTIHNLVGDKKKTQVATMQYGR